jgi:CRISPR-associated protein Csb2
MSTILLISVRLHDGRYHGTGDWPPTPARLFQALVAGAGLKGPMQASDVEALEWLEMSAPPIIASPVARKGQAFDNFVPNNDLDAVGGDPRRIGSVRGKKAICPLLFDEEQPLLYAWALRDDAQHDTFTRILCQLSEGVYQLGRGVDLAWAWAEVIEEAELGERLAAYDGIVHRPSIGGDGKAFACPMKGSFQSLEDRYAANQQRFEVVAVGRSVSQSFRQLPKPRFQSVTYDSPAVRKVFDVRSMDDQPQSWDLEKASVFVQTIRNAANARLLNAFPSKAALIDHWLIGRKADGSNGGKSDERIHIIPIPSIGHTHADHAIRRVLLEIPTSCPLRADDLSWAFNGLELGQDGFLGRLMLADDMVFLDHFGFGKKFAVWKTITPAALPVSAGRRRIEPSRKLQEAKNATERAIEQQQARLAILTALRHAGVNGDALNIIVQREPFQAHGAKAEAFAPGTRFAKERLWHVALEFSEAVKGPLVVGDGRFLGLGVFAPVADSIRPHEISE